jgi:hypothetical protein
MPVGPDRGFHFPPCNQFANHVSSEVEAGVNVGLPTAVLPDNMVRVMGDYVARE